MPKPDTVDSICSDEYYETMLKCWQDNPNERPSFKWLHEYFDGYMKDLDE